MVACSGQADYRTDPKAYRINLSRLMRMGLPPGMTSSFQAIETTVTSVVATGTRDDNCIQLLAGDFAIARRHWAARMTRLPYLAFVVLAVVLLIDLGLTSPPLAEPVATHFDGGGNANGWMSRNGYVVFMIAFGIGLPLLIMGLIRVAPARFPGRLRIPNRSYWLAPERREETLQFLNAHVAWLATLMVLFVIAIHHLVLLANASQPPRLPQTPFLSLLGSFLAGLAVWIGVLWYRFRREP